MVKVAASILSADFAHLAREIKRLEEAKVDAIHIDVMDGHFVPNLSLGPKIVAAIRKSTTLFLDVHLMMYNPFEYVEKFVEAGANGITFHFEATEDVEETLKYIRKCNVKAGLCFNPETSFSMIPKYLAFCDHILLMSVHPGFGGQKFLPEVLEKIALTKEICQKLKLTLEIQVDGGITPETAKEAVNAGANYLISGDYLFSELNLEAGVRALKNCLEGKQ